MRMAPPEENADPTADPWAEFIRVTAPEFRKPTIEQIETVTKPIWEALVAGERYSHERLMEIWDDVRPDVVCTDNVTGYPAVELAGCPWVRFVSANPLEMRDPDLPPAAVGPAGRRPERVGGLPRRSTTAQHEDLLAEHNDFRASVGVGAVPARRVQHELSVAQPVPVPRDRRLRPRSRPLDATWHRLNSTVRTSEAPFDVDEHVPGDGKVVYLSLGSLGCMDVGLMQRLIDAMAKTEHRTIVSMGPLKDQMTLGPNMYGDQFLPQPSILPQCDLLITHGGNNTVCEGFHFGLPMIGLPLFWDQYDNAQRLRETGLRRTPADVRLERTTSSSARSTGCSPTTTCGPACGANAEAIRADPGHVRGADILESVMAGA